MNLGSDLPSSTSSLSSGVARPAPSPLRPGIVDWLSGEQRVFARNLRPYLPPDLVGGAVPYVPGAEDEAVWNAASQACGTEKVNYVYSVFEDRCWYLACPSSVLASEPDTWCPMAAALPGNSEYWDKETVYIFEQEGMSSALRWDPETGRMQVFSGASRTLLPRIQSMDANFVTINPDVAQVVPWRNRFLRTEQLSRASVRLLLLSGVSLALLLLVFLGGLYASVGFTDRQLASVRQATDSASNDLIAKAYESMKNPVANHMVRVQQLLDRLPQFDGTLVRYEVDASGGVSWEALASPAQGQVVTGILGGQVQPGFEKDGRIRIKGAN